MRPVIGVGAGPARHREIVVASSAATAHAGLPPGRPYVLTIKGENTVTFFNRRPGWRRCRSTTRRALLLPL